MCPFTCQFDHLQSETIANDPGGNNGAESYTYDAVGNRKTLSSTIPSLPGSMSYTYDTNDRLTTDSYDNNGNTTSSSGISFTYDFENRLLMKGAVINVSTAMATASVRRRRARRPAIWWTR